ncbi:MAG TPA: DUF4252 domain-containing protein [Granulicella sp.]|jgi:hypothetical protein|nr:DUF4252 domain-containing protein [Granulicella sp.]
MIERRSLQKRIERGVLAGVLMVGLGAPAMGAPQVPDTLFAGAERFAKGAKSTTEVNLDKSMLAMAGKFMQDSGKEGGKEKDKAKDKAADLAGKMDFVIVRSYEYASPGQYKRADLDEFQHRLDADGWSHIVKERSETESTDVCVKTDSEGQFSELVVISAEPLELTFVHLKGHMSMQELTRMGGRYGVPQNDPSDESKLKTRDK